MTESLCCTPKAHTELPQWLSMKESDCRIKYTDLITGLGRFPGGGNGNPFQYSYLGNSMGRGSWQATVHGVAKNWT